MLSLLRASLLVGITTVGTVLAGLIRAKLTALWLGRAGIGILSQSQNVALLIGGIASFGIGTGLLAAVSRARSQGDKYAISTLVDSAILVIGIPISILGAIGTVGSHWLAPLAFGAAHLRGLALATAMIGGAAMAVSPIPGALLYAHGKVSTYVAASLISTTAGLLVLVVLIFFFGLPGALLHVAIGPVLTTFILCLITQRALPREYALWGRWPLKPSRSAITELLAYTAYSVTASVAYYLSQVSARGLVLHRLGDEANGVLQAAVAIGSYLKQLVSGGLTADLFPTAAQSNQTPNSLTKMVRSGHRFFLAIALPGAVILAMFGNLAIRILYTREFLAATILLAPYLIGETIRLLASIPTTVLSARKHLIAAVLPIVVGEGAFLTCFALTLNRGLVAYAIAYLVGGVVTLWTAMVALRVLIGTPLGVFYTLAATALPIVAEVSLHWAPTGYMTRVAATLAMLAIAWRCGLSANERSALLRKIGLGTRTIS